ncbi:dynein regulator [Crassisporium funariophilum]|nr:dynein regulator [Crassisporium funariophilum]
MAGQLTNRQQLDLHKSMLDYLHSAGYMKTYNEFREEAPEVHDFNPDPSSPASGLLVKKWTSIIRMQRKIMELEKQLAQAVEDMANAGPMNAETSRRVNKEWLPTSNPKFTLNGHRDKINAVSFHPLYSVLASASVDATVKIWDWDTGDCERTLKSHTKAVSDCQFDSTGKVLATCSDDLFIKLWNVPDDYKNFATLRGHEHSISSVHFLPGDNQLISSSRDNTVRVWDVSTSHCVRVMKPHTEWIRSALPSADGRLLLTCSDDHTARITDMETSALKTEMRGHDNRIESAVFVPQASIPAVRELVALPANVQSAKVDSLGISFVMTASRDKTIKLWDALRGQCLWTFVGHDGWVQALTFHPCGKFLLSAADDHTMRIWDLKTGRCLRKIEAHSPFVQCVAWAPSQASEGGEDNERFVNVIATGGTDKLVKIWRP